MDRYTKEKTWIRYARVLIDISTEGPFLEYVEFINELDVLEGSQYITNGYQ